MVWQDWTLEGRGQTCQAGRAYVGSFIKRQGIEKWGGEGRDQLLGIRAGKAEQE